MSEKTGGHLEKLLPLAIADSSGVNVNESERERSGIIRGQFYGVWRGGAIFRGAQELFDVDAVLVGCGHVSGLLMRRGWPLALMLCADQIPIESTHSKMR